MDYVMVVLPNGEGGYFVPKDYVPYLLATIEGSYVEHPESIRLDTRNVTRVE